MAKSNPDRVVEKLVAEVASDWKDAAKSDVIPIGRTRLEPAELRKAWPSLGDAERRRIMAGNASPSDPTGVYTTLALLEGKRGAKNGG